MVVPRELSVRLFQQHLHIYTYLSHFSPVASTLGCRLVDPHGDALIGCIRERLDSRPLLLRYLDRGWLQHVEVCQVSIIDFIPCPALLSLDWTQQQEGRITSAPIRLAGGIRATSTSFARVAAALVACQYGRRHQPGSQQRQWQLPSQAEAATCQLPGRRGQGHHRYRPVGFNIDGDDFEAFFQRAHANKLRTGKSTFLSQATVRAFHFLPRCIVNCGHSDQYLYRPGLELCRHDFHRSSAQVAFVRSLPHLAPGKGCEPGPGLYSRTASPLSLHSVFWVWVLLRPTYGPPPTMPKEVRLQTSCRYRLPLWQPTPCSTHQSQERQNDFALCATLWNIPQACSGPAQRQGSEQAITGIILPDSRPKTVKSAATALDGVSVTRKHANQSLKSFVLLPAN